jgi:hypothetical protein
MLLVLHRILSQRVVQVRNKMANALGFSYIGNI